MEHDVDIMELKGQMCCTIKKLSGFNDTNQKLGQTEFDWQMAEWSIKDRVQRETDDVEVQPSPNLC